MTDLLSDEYFFRALAVAALAGVLCAVVGIYVVVRGISFAGDGLSHASLAGAGIAGILGFPTFLGAAIYACLLSATISTLGGSGRLREDARLAVLFTGSMALGYILLTSYPSGSLSGALFGSLIPLSSADVKVVLASTFVLLVPLFITQRRLILVAIDPEFSEVTAIRTGRYLLFMDLVIACTVVIASKAVGTLLVSSLLVVPPSIALVSAKDISDSFLISISIGLIVSIVGVIASVAFDTPPGATIALISAVVFIVFMTKERFKQK